MAPPVEKGKKFSSIDRRLISSARKIWICSDVWMDILPFFRRPQLGFKMALVSDRFDVLVDAHFDGKMELTIWKAIEIRKDKGPKAKLFVEIKDKFVEFPFLDRPLPNKIRFSDIRIKYIDHSVLAFLRSNKHIWDRMGTNLELFIWLNRTEDDHPIWDVFAHEILPIFATNIRQLGFTSGDALDNLCRRTSPTLLTDLDQLNSIDFALLCSDTIDNQILSKWLHTPRKDGQPKQLRFRKNVGPPNLEWINNFRETFRHATTTSSAVNYNIHFFLDNSTPIVPFELENERTKEKMTLKEVSRYYSDGVWLLKRCPIVGEKKDENSDAILNNFQFIFWGGINCIW